MFAVAVLSFASIVGVVCATAKRLIEPVQARRKEGDEKVKKEQPGRIQQAKGEQIAYLAVPEGALLAGQAAQPRSKSSVASAEKYLHTQFKDVDDFLAEDVTKMLG